VQPRLPQFLTCRFLVSLTGMISFSGRYAESTQKIFLQIAHAWFKLIHCACINFLFAFMFIAIIRTSKASKMESIFLQFWEMSKQGSLHRKFVVIGWHKAQAFWKGHQIEIGCTTKPENSELATRWRELLGDLLEEYL